MKREKRNFEGNPLGEFFLGTFTDEDCRQALMNVLNAFFQEYNQASEEIEAVMLRRDLEVKGRKTTLLLYINRKKLVLAIFLQVGAKVVNGFLVDKFLNVQGKRIEVMTKELNMLRDMKKNRIEEAPYFVDIIQIPEYFKSPKAWLKKYGLEE